MPTSLLPRRRTSATQAPKKPKERWTFFFQEIEFKNPIPAGTTISGYVFTNLDEGFKNINIDLLGDDLLLNFNFAVKIPGLNTDFEYVDLETVYDDFEHLEGVTAFQRRLRGEPHEVGDENDALSLPW